MRTRILFPLMAIGAALTLGAASGGVGGRADDRRLTERLGSEAAATVRFIIDSARTAGLPSQPILDKALEGIAKGATPERVVEVVREFSGELAIARTTVVAARNGATRVDAGELRAAVAALESGLAPREIAMLFSAAGNQHAIAALTAAAHLAANGVRGDSVVALVSAQLGQGNISKDLASIGRTRHRK